MDHQINNVSPRLLEFKRRADKIPRGKGYIMSKEAAHHPDDLSFRRQQSKKMADLDWEREPVWHSWLAGFGAAVFVAIVILMALAL